VSRTVDRSKFGKQPLNLSLAIDWSNPSDKTFGVVSSDDEAWSSEIITDKAAFNAKALPAVLDTNYVGSYTLVVPRTNAPSLAPGGDGYGTVTNSPGGFIALKGQVGDGEKFGQKVQISKDGDWPLYVPLYKDGLKVYQGSALGWVNFSHTTNAPEGTLSWIKTTNVAGLYYFGGFTNQVPLVSSPYVAPGLNDLPVDYVNGTLVVEDGNLAGSITNNLLVLTNKVITTLTTEKFSVSVKKKDGSFSGGFINPVNPSSKTVFKGVVLQNTTNGSGVFLGTNESGRVTLGQ
jgi:hypothetical protein